MRCVQSIMLLSVSLLCCATAARGQEMELPKPAPELDVYKADVGTWDVEIKAWQGPGEPTVTKGRETSRMMGGFWLLSNFKGNMMGLDFTGHGVYGYDADKKQYIGTWFDSLGSAKMDMIGNYDEDEHTMTFEGMGVDETGSPSKHVLATKYHDDGTRVMTMHMQAGGEMIKVFEMSYTKAKKRAKIQERVRQKVAPLAGETVK